MKSKGFFICFTGMDGTGKTTLSKELVELLNKKGISCKYVYARLNPLLLKPFILIGKWIFLCGKDISKNYSEYVNRKRKAIEKHPILSKIYQQILLLDYMLQIFFKVKLPLMLGKNIVCDRYVYDTIVTDLSIDFNYSKEDVKNSFSKILSLFPTPDITFLVDLPEEIAYQRKDDTPSLRYLKERRALYLEIGKEYGMIILEGSKTLEQLKSLIQRRVLEGGEDQ